MIRALRSCGQSFRRDQRGAVIIETAFVAPILVLLGLGAFQVSQAVARQHELQSGADDAAAMALAGWKDSSAQKTALKSVLKSTLNLTDAQVTVANKYRCGVTTAYVNVKTACANGTIVATYLQIVLKDTYTPTWAKFGFGSPLNYNVTRTVVLS